MTVLEQALDLALRTFRDHNPGDLFIGFTATTEPGKIIIQRNGGYFLTTFFPPGFIALLETEYGDKAPAFLAALIVGGVPVDPT